MLNGEQAKGFLQYFLGIMATEFPTTKKVIAAVPQDKSEWRPDPKAKTALELAWHLASAEMFFMDAVVSGAYDMSGGEAAPPKTVNEILSFYEKNYHDRVSKLERLSGEQLMKPVSFFGIMELPAVMHLNFMLMHSAHHRGQLSVYLRPMGGKVPSIYGGSADEPFAMPS